MALSYVSFTANGSTTQFAVSFNYIEQSHVKVYINNVEDTSFTWVNASLIQTSSTPSNGAVVKIERNTPTSARLVDFADGSIISEADLDKSANQNFYTVQENVDDIGDCLKLDNSNLFDATSKRIINVANPTANQDAVTKIYLSDTFLTDANKTALTTVNSNISNINAVNSNSSNINTVAGNNSNINTVAGAIANVNLTGGSITNVNTVGTDLALGNSSKIKVVNDAIANVNTTAGAITNVNSVAGALTNVNAVGSDLLEGTSEINTVATNIANVNTVGGISSNVTTVAGISSNVTSVAGNSSNINTVAGQNSNITTLAGISSDITAVAGISSDLQAVENKLTEIEAVADDLAEASSEIDLVAGSIANVNTVGGAISNVNTVAGAVANINTTASNIAGVNSFADRYRVASSDPSSSLDEGDLVYNTSSNALKYYNGSSWASVGVNTDETSKVSSNDSTAGYLNGKLVAGSNITFTENNNGSNETLTIASTDNSVVMAIALG
jgi:hypothetical protein